MKFGLFFFVPSSGFVGRGGWGGVDEGKVFFKVLGTSYKNVRKSFLGNYRAEGSGSNPQSGVRTSKIKSSLLAPLCLSPRLRPVTPGGFEDTLASGGGDP